MAGPSVIGALRVALGLDSAQFTSGAKQVETRAQRLGANVTKALRDPVGAAGALKGALGALGGALALGAMVAAAQRGLEYASSLGEVAQQLGVTTKDLQEYRYAATQVGVSQEEMDKGLAKLTVTMGQAREGVAKPKAAFKELSDLLGRDILKNAATAGDAIPLIADALARVPDPAKRAALEISLFGKTGQRLDTLLAGGSAAVNELRDAAQSLGVVLSDEQIQSADKTADKLSELKTVLEARIAGAVADNAASIYDLADSFVTLTSKILETVGAADRLRKLSLVDSSRSFSGRLNADIPSIVVGKLQGKSRAQIDEQAAYELTTGSRADRQALLTKTANEYNASKDPEFRRYLRGRQQSILKEEARAQAATKVQRPASLGEGAGTSDADRKKAAREAEAEAKRAAAERKRQAEEEERKAEAYQRDLDRTNADYLSAKLDLTVGAQKRAGIETDQLQAESVAQLDAIRLNKDLTQAQKDKLSAIIVSTSALKQDLIDRKLREQLAADALTKAQQNADNDQDILQAQAALARTTKERARIELLILRSQFDILKQAQQAIIDNAGGFRTPEEIKAAEERLKTLTSVQRLAEAKAAKDNAGPVQQYIDSLPRSAEEVNEAFQHVAADGLQSMVDGIADAASGAESLADVFDDVAGQIIRALIKIAIQRAIVGSLGKVLGGTVDAYDDQESGHAGSKGSNVLDALTGILGKGGAMSLAGMRAKGGPVIGGRTYVVGEMGAELFTPARTGTIVPNDMLGGAGGRLEIVPSPYFDVVVDGRVVRGAAPIAEASTGRGIGSVQRANTLRARQALA